ncbi:MAG: hypothetical protein AAB617_00870 [Patescibacteria group bacterium]
MRKPVLFLCGLFVTFFASSTAAQEKERKWHGEIEAFRGYVWGNDVHVGDFVVYSEEHIKLFRDVKYGAYYFPIITKPGGSFGMNYEASYKLGKRWSVGISGMSFYNKVALNEASGALLLCECVGDYGIHFWDHTLFALRNEANPDAPIPYWASNELLLWTANSFLRRTLKEGNSSRLSLGLGIKVGNLQNQRIEGQRHEAFIYDYFVGGLHFMNQVKLQSVSTTRFQLFGGPSVGFEGEARLWGFGLKASAEQAFLFADAYNKGHWTDVDEIHAMAGPQGGPFEDAGVMAVYDGETKFRSTQKMVFGATDLKLKINRSIKNRLDFGAGAFISMISGVTLAPRFSVPGEWSVGNGTAWVWGEKKNITIAGISLSAAVKF